jgi:uncharacterized C2H2 Zn-finger protein
MRYCITPGCSQHLKFVHNTQCLACLKHTIEELNLEAPAPPPPPTQWPQQMFCKHGLKPTGCPTIDCCPASNAKKLSQQARAAMPPATLLSAPRRVPPGSIASLHNTRPRRAVTTTPRVQQHPAGAVKGRGVHPYACPHCNKIHDTKYKLDRHILTHTGEKPFQCPSCGYAASQKSSLKTHIEHRTCCSTCLACSTQTIYNLAEKTVKCPSPVCSYLVDFSHDI